VRHQDYSIVQTLGLRHISKAWREGKGKFVRSRRRWKNNIKRLLWTRLGGHGMDLSVSGKGQLVASGGYFNELSGSTKKKPGIS
jgi:hypothetical protein